MTPTSPPSLGTPHSPRASVRLARGLGSLLVLLALLVGVPVLLVAVDAFPTALPTLHEVWQSMTTRDNGTVLFVVLSAGVWLCWALFALATVQEAWAVLRGRQAHQVRGFSPFQRPAAGLVMGVAVLFAANLAHSTAAQAAVTLDQGLGMAQPLARHASQALLDGVSNRSGLEQTALPSSAPLESGLIAAVTSRSQTVEQAQASQSTGAWPTVVEHADQRASTTAPIGPGGALTVDEQGVARYTVKRFDSLWSIAQNYLGDGQRYHEIADLNPTQVDGEGTIKVGAVLVMPPVMPEVLPQGVAENPQHRQVMPSSSLPHAEAPPSPTATVTVKPGDTLWGLAQEHLGDGRRYPQIVQANEAVRQPDGATLSDPDLIQPGWTFTLEDPDEQLLPAPPSLEQLHHDLALMSASSPLDESPAAGAQHPAAGVSVAARYLSLACGAGLLAAGSAVALTRGRRRQFRFRRPGRAMPGIPAACMGMEQALLAAGRLGQDTASLLDLALRDLVSQVRQGQLSALPEVVAASINATELTLLVEDPTVQLPHPWSCIQPGRWSLPREVARCLQVDRANVAAPYPCLVGVGYTDEGTEWLVDLEHAGVVQVGGDVPRATNLARYLAAQLATNQWSDHLTVTLAGFGADMVAACPERLAYSPHLGETMARLARDAHANTQVALPMGDVLAGRVSGQSGDRWMPQVVLVLPSGAQDSPDQDCARAWEGLQTLQRQLSGRSATAVAVVVGSPPGQIRVDAPAWSLHVDAQGQVSIPALGIQARAHQLPPELAREWAVTLADARAAKPQAELAAAGTSGPSWRLRTNVAGAVAVEFCLPREEGSPEPEQVPQAVGVGRTHSHVKAVPSLGLQENPLSRAGKHSKGLPPLSAVPHLPTGIETGHLDQLSVGSLLPLPTQVYVDCTATTAQDVQVLAPVVPLRIREELRAADPSLDADVREWKLASGPRPLLRLLGPVSLRAWGRRPDKQVDFCTEVVAYMAYHPQGVSSAQLASDLWPDKNYSPSSTYPREMVSRTRHWLGEDPAGQRFLPEVSRTGSDVYRLQGVLVDVDLFRRLRARGQSRGAEGLTDLVQALELVTGAPLDRRRLGGYGWLDPGEEYLYTAMIVDVAHVVATQALATGDLQLARQACEVARHTGSSDDIALLDLAALHYAQGFFAEAEAVIAKVLTNNEAQVEEDLPPRTYEVLLRLRTAHPTRQFATRA